jgi:hypothetical protein
MRPVISKDKKIQPRMKYNFDFDEEIPFLNMKTRIGKEESKKVQIKTIKSKKNGRTRDNSTGLF